MSESAGICILLGLHLPTCHLNWGFEVLFYSFLPVFRSLICGNSLVLLDIKPIQTPFENFKGTFLFSKKGCHFKGFHWAVSSLWAIKGGCENGQNRICRCYMHTSAQDDQSNPCSLPLSSVSFKPPCQQITKHRATGSSQAYTGCSGFWRSRHAELETGQRVSCWRGLSQADHNTWHLTVASYLPTQTWGKTLSRTPKGRRCQSTGWSFCTVALRRECLWQR